MMLEWIDGGGGEQQIAIAPDGDTYTIFAVDADGTLRILGENWKECPGPTRCRRKQRAGRPDRPACAKQGAAGRCKGCRRAGIHLGSVERARRIAEGIARRCLAPPSPRRT
jgi:hypothetical protein